MSTKISLYFIERIMPDYADLDIFAIRLCCDVAFRTASGVTAPYRAIIDTGAPLSLLPLHVWKQCKVKKIRDSAIRGVVPRPECILPVTLADLTCMLVDGQNKTSELPIKAQLAHTDEVPLVIGFREKQSASIPTMQMRITIWELSTPTKVSSMKRYLS